MADRVLVLTWKDPARGREERAVESFNDVVGYYGRKQQEGKLEKFDIVFCEPNGDLGGYMEIHGTPEQLSAMREDEEFQRLLVEASLVVDDLRICAGFTGAAIADQMTMYTEAISKVPQAG